MNKKLTDLSICNPIDGTELSWIVRENIQNNNITYADKKSILTHINNYMIDVLKSDDDFLNKLVEKFKNN